MTRIVSKGMEGVCESRQFFPKLNQHAVPTHGCCLLESMTRINSNLSPKQLTRVHLVAELREITMVPAALRRSLRTKSVDVVINSIPAKFTLNAGHVKFFYNKLEFLKNRFSSLADEMDNRGFNADRTRVAAFDGFDPIWYNDWESDPADDALVIDRINLRIAQKPHLYKDNMLTI